MLKLKTYSCQICKTKPDQISHHKSHLETEKHTDKAELFQLKLSKLTQEQLLEKYNSIDFEIIIDALINTVYEYKDNKNNNKNDNKKDNKNDNKKLNNETTKQEDNINTSENTNTVILTPEEMAAQNTTDTITNKEALKDKIHELHNYLRNNGAGYGMNALKVFNILYGLKKIEEKNLFEKANLKVPDAKFSYLLELANENTSQSEHKLVEQILKHALNAIHKSNIKDLLMYEIPKEIKGSVFAHLIKEIDNITKIEQNCNVLLSGKIYEYFIGRDETAISELGAYFTNTYITDYIFYNKLKPIINEDGTIRTMADIFGGAGGFTTGYINYLISTYNNSTIDKVNYINWETELKKIFHFDINQDVIKSAGLEFFCLTGTLPDMKNNLCYANSFVDSNDKFKDTKFKYVVTNPPYGGDKNKESDAQVKRNKIKECIKKILASITNEDRKAKLSIQLKEIEKAEKAEKKESEKTKVSIDMASARIKAFANKYSLKGNDKESVSLMLIMDIVDLGGTAIGVLKEGVFFNKTYKALRKCLVENFNVREIISVPQDQFENTSTKTSIVIFDNLENIKTTEVKFYDLVVEKYTEDKFIEGNNGFIYLLENKDDIKGVSDKLISSATCDEILNNPIVSLNGKDYNKKEIICDEGYELVKLGDICESQNGYAFKTTEYKEEGIPLVTITHIKDEKIVFNNNHYIDENDKYKKFIINKNDIIISLTGKKPKLCSIALHNNNDKLYLNQRCGLFRNFKKINNYYFMAIFNGFMMNYINQTIGNGSNQENVSLTDILKIQIPIPKTTAKIAEWVEKISKPYDEKNTKQEKIQELEKLIQSTIKNITENEECDEVEFDTLLTYLSKKNKYKANDGYVSGLYKFYTSSQDKILYRNDYEFEDTCILIGRGGNPSLHITSRFSVSHDDVYVINLKNNKNLVLLQYIFNYLKINMSLITNSFKGSTIKHTSKDGLSKIKIKIPKNKKIIEDMELSFKEIERLQSDVKKAEDLYKQLIKELSQEAIPNQPIINEVINDSNDDTESTETEIQEEEIVEIPITTKSKKISIKSSKSKKTSTTLNDILSNDD